MELFAKSHRVCADCLALSKITQGESSPGFQKVFVFFGVGEENGGIGLCVKLPSSGVIALSLPFAEPAGYNLGKSGWVAVKFPETVDVPRDVLRVDPRELPCMSHPRSS